MDCIHIRNTVLPLSAEHFASSVHFGFLKASPAVPHPALRSPVHLRLRPMLTSRCCSCCSSQIPPPRCSPPPHDDSHTQPAHAPCTAQQHKGNSPSLSLPLHKCEQRHLPQLHHHRRCLHCKLQLDTRTHSPQLLLPPSLRRAAASSPVHVASQRRLDLAELRPAVSIFRS